MIAGNQAAVYGGGAYFESSRPALWKCTISHNAAWQGGGIFGYYESSIDVECSIVSFSTDGESVRCLWNTDVTLSGCNVYGNAGGDWIDCIEAQLGTGGNFSGDPLYCEPDSGNFSLDAGSSSLDVAGCGRIGAMGVGCDVATSSPMPGASAGGLELFAYPNPSRDGLTVREGGRARRPHRSASSTLEAGWSAGSRSMRRTAEWNGTGAMHPAGDCLPGSTSSPSGRAAGRARGA